MLIPPKYDNWKEISFWMKDVSRILSAFNIDKDGRVTMNISGKTVTFSIGEDNALEITVE